MRQVILDTETTGLSVQEGDRVIELGCVELVNRQLSGQKLHEYFNVDRDSDPGALRVHGITREFLSSKPRFEERAAAFVAFVQGAELVIHNAPFDVGFLDQELRLAGLEPLSSYVAGITDSLVLAKASFPGKRNSLDALCERFGIDRSSRTLHGALLDCELLAQVYLSLTRGQNALLDPEDEAQTSAGEGGMARGDYSKLVLPVLQAAAPELAAHEQVLQAIDRESGGRTLWRTLQQNQ